ncbi:MAG: hypothetical protein IKT25_06085, partial [Firmicutes bacterium]|nr:hypothetical protein [Bacillota bacterium]
MDLISLVVLCSTLGIAFIFKINSGLASIAAALILSWFSGISGNFLIGSFNNSLFLMLFGVMYLFSIAQENKTLELFAKKTFALCRGHERFLPVVMFLIAALMSAVGPGLISVTALISVLIIALAKEMNTQPIRLAPFGVLGAFAGGLTPITPSGIVAVTISEKSGIIGVEAHLTWKMVLTCVVYAAILYFFIFKWHRYKRTESVQSESVTIEAFSAKQ